MSDVARLRDAPCRETITVYALEDTRPADQGGGDFFYIGQAKDPDDRLQDHLYQARLRIHKNQALARRLLAIEAAGYRVQWYPVCQCRSRYEAAVEETRAIKAFDRLAPLINLQHNPNQSQARPFTQQYLERIEAA